MPNWAIVPLDLVQEAIKNGAECSVRCSTFLTQNSLFRVNQLRIALETAHLSVNLNNVNSQSARLFKSLFGLWWT